MEVEAEGCKNGYREGKDNLIKDDRLRKHF